jgi:spore maturation protein CgeB
MRILYTALKYDYGIKEMGYSYEYENFYSTLLSLGHEVLEFDFMSILRQNGKDAMNRLLINTVHEFKPHILFCCLFSDQFDYETFHYISKETKTITVNWFSDDAWRFETYSRYWCWCFDYIATTDHMAMDKYKAIGYSNALLTQFACNIQKYAKLELPKKYEVSFVGQSHGERAGMINQLTAEGIPVACWGSNWPNGRLSQEEMIRVFNQSKINLNFCAASVEINNQAVYQMKARIFEIPGCGAFLLTDHAPGLESYYTIGQEIECFSDVQDLVDKVKYYLTHDREREHIALHGYIRTNTQHTFEKRFEHLLGYISGRGKSR